MAQPLTFCNINNFNCFQYTKMCSTTYSVSLMRGKCFFVTFYKLKTGFSDYPNHPNLVLDDWSNPMEQHDVYLVSIALSV